MRQPSPFPVGSGSSHTSAPITQALHTSSPVIPSSDTVASRGRVGFKVDENVQQKTITEESSIPSTSANDPPKEQIVEVSPDGRYAKLNVLLGKGAYKVVWKALDREEGIEVAWNCFQTSRAESVALHHEIDILKRVQHPNIIACYDSWYNDVELVFITELMTSGTLREYIHKFRGPNIKMVKRWSRQILKGLAYLHANGIIHRDIKCDNVFVNGAHGEVKVGDLGTAKMKSGKKYTVIGTPEFMAPEMYEDRGYTEKVDVYAFGMCCLEMVCGDYPYSECKNAAQIYKKVSQGIKPECLSKVTDPEVLDLIHQCLSDEAHRPSAAQLLDHSFLSVEPEVTLVACDETRTQLVLQVVFRGTDKMSVKFEFQVGRDTAEEVVHEMIVEEVLPAKYQTLITVEINRLLRDLMHKPSSQPQTPLSMSNSQLPNLSPLSRSTSHDNVPQQHQQAQQSQQSQQNQQGQQNQQNQQNQQQGSSSVPSTITSNASDDRKTSLASNQGSVEQLPAEIHALNYEDSCPIAVLVQETARLTQRDAEKARYWLDCLYRQDLQTVGDLRALRDDDWPRLQLTVFAARALYNAVHGRSRSEG